MKEIVRIARARDTEAAPPTFLSRDGERFFLSGHADVKLAAAVTR